MKPKEEKNHLKEQNMYNLMATKNNQISIRRSTPEYLTYVTSVGGGTKDVEARYEDENIFLLAH